MPTIHQRHGLHRRPRRPLSARRGRAAAVVLLAAATVAPLLGSSAVAAPGSRTYDQQAYLKAESVAAGDIHGTSVALDRDTAVIGAPAANGDPGKVTVYVRDGATWTIQATLTPSDASGGNLFGFSVGLDGETLVVGDPGSGRNRVYVFTRSGGVWTEQATIAGTSTDGGRFGESVDIDAGTIVVGGIWDGSGGTTVGGAISVFVGAGDTWTRQAVLTGAAAEANDQLGTDVAIDGDTVVGGAYLEDGATTDPVLNGADAAGAAYVYLRSGTTWTQQAYLKAPTPVAGDNFGGGVAVDGDTVMVGAPKQDTNGNASGAVHVFTRSGATWTHRTPLYPSDAAANQEFGRRIALQGGTAAIGREGGLSGGGVYLFTGSSSSWTEEAILRGDNAESGDQNGTDVAIDGETVLSSAKREASAAAGVDPTGTPGPDDNSATSAGAAYIHVSSDWSAPTEDAPAVAKSLLSLGAPVVPVTPGPVLRAPITGGDSGIDILWRLRDADGQVVAEGPVTLDDAGNGTIELTLPSGLVGSMTLELVDWGVTATFDVTGPVPTAVRAGEGSLPTSWLLATLLAAASTLGLGVRTATGSRRG